MNSTRFGLIGMLLALLGLTAVFSRPAAAAPTVDFVVNALDDTTDGTCDAAHCSLREAIIIANGNPDQNTITFSVTGTIVLESTLVVGHDLVIDGTGQDISLSGDSTVRVLTLTAGDNIPILEIRSLTIVKGGSSQGAAIFNGGGELIVTDSTFGINLVTDRGGAIYNGSGAVTTVRRSSFIANDGANYGGAIYNELGLLFVEDTTFSGNGATFGGGIRNTNGTVTIANSTFDGNGSFSSGGAFFQDGGTTTITNSTIAGNSATNRAGGGITNIAGVVTVANTILDSNAPGNCEGSFVDGGYNIDSGVTCAWGAANGSLSSTDPGLEIALGNGGPTNTAMPLSGSPAIDMVPAADCPLPTDQRGVPRPVGAACDAGAVEVNPQSGPNLVVNALNDAAGSCDLFVAGASDCSLREAMLEANRLPGKNTITFAVSGALMLNGTLPTVGDDLLIDGGDNVSVYGRGYFRLLKLAAGNTIPELELRRMYLFKGAADFGGAILNQGGELLISRSGIESSTATEKGGAIFNDGGAVTISDSTIAGHAAPDGGALYNQSGTLTVMRSWFYNNKATSDGVVLYNAAGTTTLVNSTVTENSSADADTILNGEGSLTIINSTFAKNSSAAGSIHNGAGSVVVRNTILDDVGGKNCAGPIGNGGNNIEGGASCGWGSADGSMSDTDPLLGQSGYHGGLSPVYALLPDSPAIDGVAFDAPNECPATDQRGVARPQGDFCDIGAFEVEQEPPESGYTVYLPVVLGD